MSFLPEDYKAPSSNNNYAKLNEGENKFRILSKPILGWEDWKEKKPVRFAYNKKPVKSIDPAKPVKHFWAFIVWNYDTQAIQILSITQATIRSNLEALCKDSDWGDPYFYDIKIIKTGEGTDTEYKVNPLPHKPVNEEIKKAFNSKRCYLDAHLDCMDPFAPEWPSFTAGIFTKEDLEKVNKVVVATDPFEDDKIESMFISQKEAEQLKVTFSMCSQEYQKKFTDKLSRLNPPVLGFEKLPRELYNKVKESLDKESYETQLRFDGGSNAA